MRSRLERSGNDQRWHAPDPQLLGRFGESDGPTVEEVRLGAHLRKALKTGASWEAPLERGGSIAITSGRPALKSVETTPPVETYDGPDSDSYDNIPF